MRYYLVIQSVGCMFRHLRLCPPACVCICVHLSACTSENRCADKFRSRRVGLCIRVCMYRCITAYQRDSIPAHRTARERIYRLATLHARLSVCEGSTHARSCVPFYSAEEVCAQNRDCSDADTNICAAECLRVQRNNLQSHVLQVRHSMTQVGSVMAAVGITRCDTIR